MALFNIVLVCVLFGLPGLMSCWDLLYYLFKGERFFKKASHALGTLIMVYALVVLLLDIPTANNCCGDTTALFSPHHRLTPVVLILLCLGAYFYSTFRTKIASPVLEIVVNSLLITGLVLDVFVGFQEDDWICWCFGNVPVANFFVLALMENHKMALADLEQQDPVSDSWL